MATRSRKGYWRMSANSIVQPVLSNRWLHEQRVPDMRTLRIASPLRAESPGLIGTARCGPACRAVWEQGLAYWWVSPRRPDSHICLIKEGPGRPALHEDRDWVTAERDGKKDRNDRRSRP